jgi:glycosyltransferase involved in cell wall biosynthesis
MIHFFYISAYDASEKGAIGTHTKGIIGAALASEEVGNSTVFLSSESENFLKDFPIKRRVCFKPLFQNKFLTGFARLLYCLQVVFGLLILPAKGKPEKLLFYVRRDLFFATLIVLIAGIKFPGSKIVLEYNDLFNEHIKLASNWQKWSRFGKLVRTSFFFQRIVEIDECLSFLLSTLVVLVTPRHAEYVNKLCPKAKTLVVPNATERKIIADSKEADFSELRKEHGFSEDLFYIAHVGTITVWDGLSELLQAFHNCKHREKMRLIIAGTGSLKTELLNTVEKLQLNELVLFMDAMPHKEALNLLRASDLVPLLKVTHQSPIKYYEALGCGKPMISSDMGVLNEIEKLGFGKVVSLPLNIQTISQTIDFMWENRALYTARKNKILSYSEKQCTWDKRFNCIIEKLYIK